MGTGFLFLITVAGVPAGAIAVVQQLASLQPMLLDRPPQFLFISRSPEGYFSGTTTRPAGRGGGKHSAV